MAVEAFGIATAAIGLAATVFQTAKGIRDIIHNAMSEKQEILALLQENQAEMDFLAQLYKEHKEYLDQTKLTQDLQRFRAKIDDHYKWLVKVDDGKPHRRVPTLRAVWRAGDLKRKLEAWNRDITRVRADWQNQVNLRMVALLQDTKSQVLDRLDNQDRVQISMALTLGETIRAEATEVIKVIQHTTVQTRTRSLSVHSQVEPDGFSSQTTRVVVNKTSSLATFSILSPDASLSYDQIKMRLEEYSQLLKSDTPTIEFYTKNGKTIMCQKQVGDMKKHLEQAKDLLQAMIEAKDVPTIEVIHRLCDLAKVLDHLKLQEECLVVGDCAIKLARAFSLRAVEFQQEEAKTILQVARLSVYKSQACPLFIQAISICDAFVIMDGSDIAKVTLLHALDTAGAHDETPPELCAQWLSRAVDLISELPSAMVPNKHRGCIYTNYGFALGALKVDSKALAAMERAVAFYRSLDVGHGQAMYKDGLALALFNYGDILHDMGYLEDALSVEQEVISLYRALAVGGHKEHKMNLADALYNHGLMLHDVGRCEDALSVEREAISLYRTLAVDGHEEYKRKLANALNNYGISLHNMGHLEEARGFRQEALSLRRTLAGPVQEEHKTVLALPAPPVIG